MRFKGRKISVCFLVIAGLLLCGGTGSTEEGPDFKVLSSRYKNVPQQKKDSLLTATLQDHNSAGEAEEPGDSYPEALREVPGRHPGPDLLSARSAVVLDGVTGEILYAHSPDLPGQPASTIKILTALIALNSLDDAEAVEVSEKAAAMPRSKIDLHAGETYPAGDLICAALLASANDASVALAEDIAGSERIFTKLMNYKAKKMGAHHTVCKTATGLTAPGQESTVMDLAMLFNKAMQQPDFSRIMSCEQIITKDGMILKNHNKALWRVYGAEGGKTGFTRAAGQTYVGKFCRNDDQLIVALMGSEKMWDDVRFLVTYGFSRRRKIDAGIARQSPEPFHSGGLINTGFAAKEKTFEYSGDIFKKL